MLREERVISLGGTVDCRPSVATETYAHDMQIMEEMNAELRGVIIDLTSPGEKTIYQLPYNNETSGGGEISNRIMVFRPEALTQKDSLAEIGFFGTMKNNLSVQDREALAEGDEKIRDELAQTSVLSYSSRKLSSGQWANVVVLPSIKSIAEISGTSTHHNVVIGLAHNYASIAIHRVSRPGGLFSEAPLERISTKSF